MKLLAVLASLFAVTVAHADIRYFAYSYSWYTMPKGGREIEMWSTHTGADKWQGQIELEYGVTDRLSVAPYLVYETERGEPDLKGGKLEARYRFGSFRTRQLLPAVYAEVEKLDKEAAELELKLIASYAPSDTTLASANLVYEKSLGGGEPEWEYTFGVVDLKPEKFWYGIEAHGSLKEANNYLGPTVGLYLAQDARLIIAPSFSLNKEPNKLRLILSWGF